MIESRRLAMNLIASWGANVVKVLMQLIMLPLMARFLGPAEMGLYTLAMPLIAFVMPLTDAGLGNSLARENLDNHKVWSTAFWVLVLIGICLAVGSVGSSYIIAYFAKQPKLPTVILALSVIFLLLPCSIIPGARMIQKGRLIAMPMGDMCANLLSAMLGAYCAYASFGVWAMVIQYVSVFFFRTLIFGWLEFYLPRLHFDLKSLAGHMQLGGSITGSKLTEFGGRIMENSQISRSLGAEPLGTFGFATQVSRFLCEAVSNSVWANLYYAALHAEQAALKDILLRMMRLLGLILFPASCLGAALAPTVLPLLLGHKWVLAGWPLTILCLTYPYVVIANMTGAVLYARGQGKIPVWTSVFYSVARYIAVVVFSGYGLNAVCIAVGVVGLVQATVSIFVTQASIGHKAWKIIGHLIWPIIFSLMGFLLVLYMLKTYSDIRSQALALGLFFAIYILGELLFDTKLFVADIRGFAGMVFKKRAKKDVPVQT